MGWDRVGWNAMGGDGIGEVEWDWMGWDRVGWNGMGCNVL